MHGTRSPFASTAVTSAHVDAILPLTELIAPKFHVAVRQCTKLSTNTNFVTRLMNSQLWSSCWHQQERGYPGEPLGTWMMTTAGSNNTTVLRLKQYPTGFFPFLFILAGYPSSGSVKPTLLNGYVHTTLPAKLGILGNLMSGPCIWKTYADASGPTQG